MDLKNEVTFCDDTGGKGDGIGGNGGDRGVVTMLT